MSTPRKPWFRVPTKLFREPWPRDVKLTFVLLQAYLTDRWARDRLTAEEACRAVLSQGDLKNITGRAQLTHSRRALRVLSECIQRARSVHEECTLRELEDLTEIYWPNFAILQALPSDSRERPGRDSALSAPAPAPAPAEESLNPSLSPLAARPKAEAAPPQRPKISRKSPGTRAPDELGAEAIQALEQWTRENLPSELIHVRAHIDACLDHFRAKGQPMVDWVATCRNWIRRSPEMRRPGARAPITTPARKQTREELIEIAKRLHAVEYDRRLHGEI